MKIFTYNGKDPIVVPPDHIVIFAIFAEGSRVREAFAMAEADRVNKAVNDADSRVIDKAMLRESFNLAVKEILNSGAVPSAFYGALERQIFGESK